ncbi:MAG: glycosyltransferase family 39 protein [Acidobacteriota bacterium]
MERLGRHSKDAVALLAIAAGAFLRFDGLGTPSYWLDEILGQRLTTAAASGPWWRWLAGFAEEHGPLYYATQLAARAFGSSEAAGRLPAALLGLAAIALVWLAAKQRDAVAAAAAAILLAVSPLHVYYSREARPYALMMFLTAALIVVLLRARSIAAAAALIVALLYSSATAAPVVAAALIVAVAAALLMGKRWYWIVAAIAAGALALFPVVYAAKPMANESWPAFPPLDYAFFATLLRTFSVSALGTHAGGRAAVAMLALALIGVVAAMRRDRVEGVVIGGMALLPLAIALGALKHLDHFYAARYVTPALVGYVLLAGIGIASVARLVLQRAPLVLALAIVAALASQEWRAARTEAFRKLDWRAIAAKIERYARPDDVVIADQPWTEVSLRYYLRRLPKGATLEGVPYVSVAQLVIGAHPAAWLVTAGSDNEVRAWMCRYPMVLGSPLERFRLHYTGDFLRERAGPAEWRAASAAIGPRLLIDLAAAENRYLDAGWADPEGFRWAMGTRASVTFPRWGRRDRTIRMRVLPFHHGALPAQTLRASLNGRPLGELTLAPGWTERSIAAPAAVWRDGLNTLAFDFGRAAAPADLDPKATDRRELAVAFAWIAVEDPLAAAPGSLYSVRLASGPFIDEKTAWRNTRTRFPPATLCREPVEALIGRLGFDPLEVWPRLARGELHLDDVVETIAYGSDCEDDRAFLRRAYAVLLQRLPEPAEERELAKLPRARVPGRMIKSDEFRRLVILTLSEAKRKDLK